MGYRSEVGLMVVRDSKEAPSIPEVIAMAKAKGIVDGKTFGEGWNHQDYGWDDDRFLFYVEWVKWYESFPEVSAITNLYKFFDEMNTDDEGDERKWYSGKFCRTGEEINDNDEEAFGEGWQIESLGFERRVYVDEDLDLLGNQNKLSDVNKEEPSHA